MKRPIFDFDCFIYLSKIKNSEAPSTGGEALESQTPQNHHL